MKKYGMERTIKLALKNGTEKEVSWDGKAVPGVEYEVFIDSRSVGFLYQASEAIYDGGRFMFTKVVDDEAVRNAFISGESVEDALPDLLDDILFM